MQYRTYKFKELAEPYTWMFPNAAGEMNTYINKDTLVYAAGGAVANYSIDNDYMVANNSTVELAQETDAVAGQIIALIDGSDTHDIGLITSVDNENLKILYKSMLSLFDGNILNPARESGDDSEIRYLYDGVDGTARILAQYFASNGVDKFRRLPLRIRTSGGGRDQNGNYCVPAIWNYKENSVNVRSWLVDLFDKHNVVLQFRLIFEASRAYIEIYIQHNTTGGRLIKANIHGLTVNHTEESAAAATVCEVIDSETKALLSTWYLLDDNTVTQDASAPNRVQPYKLTVSEFDAENEDGATPRTIAEDAMLYSDFNHYINITMNRDSGMFPKNLSIGDAVTVVTEIEDMVEGQSIDEDYEDKVYKSIYTGRKESGTSSEITLIFGKIRISYTDLIQMRQAKMVRG